MTLLLHCPSRFFILRVVFSRAPPGANSTAKTKRNQLPRQMPWKRHSFFLAPHTEEAYKSNLQPKGAPPASTRRPNCLGCVRSRLTLEPLPNSNRREYKCSTTEKHCDRAAVQRTNITDPNSAVITLAAPYCHVSESQPSTDCTLAGQDAGKNSPDKEAGNCDQKYFWHIHCGFLLFVHSGPRNVGEYPQSNEVRQGNPRNQAPPRAVSCSL